MIHPERVKFLNDEPPRSKGRVLYWMQQSQRAEFNHALEFAIRAANERREPLVAVFGLTTSFPQAQARHYVFMLEGLRETQRALRKRGVPLVVLLADPPQAVAAMSARTSLVVTDAGYLRVQRAWRREVARAANCRVVQVESDVVVPTDVVSGKEEYAARTIRPKVHKHLSRFMAPLEETELTRRTRSAGAESIDISDPRGVVAGLPIEERALPVDSFTGGTAMAEELLQRFLASGIRAYADRRSDPGAGVESDLSPYLHFGQLSPLRVALAVRSSRGVPRAAKDDFLEELIVRRELAMNFCLHNSHYDRYTCLPEWAVRTLEKHAGDAREYGYSYRLLESGATHDPYWNAAQREMVLRGKMHGYMRMYWGKKIIEWTRSPRLAFRTALRLNNVYELDGRDPNSFAGVAWCFGKHDRPWKERAVFGQVRWMSADGLRRKFDMDAYLDRVDALGEGREERGGERR